MKTLRYIGMALAAITLTFGLVSCGGDDDDDITPDTPTEDPSGDADEETASISTVGFVDLGLPSGTLWASCNLGASKPEEAGGYYAWGENETKSTYAWSNYKYCSGTKTTLTKYCTQSDYGTVDNLTELLYSDNAPNCSLVGYDMPSKEQMDELRANCTWTWMTYNGKPGYRVTGKSGQSIFLPAAGLKEGSALDGDGTNGYYWTKTLGTSYSSDAYTLYFNDYRGALSSVNTRCSGLCIRPVKYVNVKVTGITLSSNALTMKPGSTQTLTATIAPSNASIKALTWTSSDTSVATVDASGKVTAVANGLATITARAKDGSGVKATCTVAVNNAPANLQAIDLGLTSGTKWANMNVGATSIEGYGDYFAWGEVVSKDSYSSDSYSCKSFSGDVLDPEADAAYVNWGSDWRMPTYAQIQELLDECTLSSWTVNGIKGVGVKGPNGNVIFLPYTGYRDSSSLYGVGSYGNYWSRTLNSDYQDDAYSLYFNSSNHGTDYSDRYYGRSVRPVYAK